MAHCRNVTSQEQGEAKARGVRALDTLRDGVQAAIGHLGRGFLQAVVRELAFTSRNGLRRPVDYRGIGAAELGSIYESLLELHRSAKLTQT